MQRRDNSDERRARGVCHANGRWLINGRVTTKHRSKAEFTEVTHCSSTAENLSGKWLRACKQNFWRSACVCRPIIGRSVCRRTYVSTSCATPPFSLSTSHPSSTSRRSRPPPPPQPSPSTTLSKPDRCTRARAPLKLFLISGLPRRRVGRGPAGLGFDARTSVQWKPLLTTTCAWQLSARGHRQLQRRRRCRPRLHDFLPEERKAWRARSIFLATYGANGLFISVSISCYLSPSYESDGLLLRSTTLELR